MAAKLVSARTGEFQQAVLATTVSTQHEDLRSYFNNPNEVEKQKILLGLESLQGARNQYPPVLGSALGDFLAHAMVLLEKKAPWTSCVYPPRNLDAVDTALSLSEDVKDLIEGRESLRTKQEQIAFGLALTALIGLALFFAFTPRAVPAASPTAIAPVPANFDPTDTTLDLSAPRVEVPDTLTDTIIKAVEPGPEDHTDHVVQEFLTQAVRASGKQLASHIGLMSEVYAEISQAVKESQTSLVVGDTQSANAAIVAAKAKLGELGDLLDLDTVPKLIDATRRGAHRCRAGVLRTA